MTARMSARQLTESQAAELAADASTLQVSPAAPIQADVSSYQAALAAVVPPISKPMPAKPTR